MPVISFQNKSFPEYLIFFFFCLAVILGPAYALFDSYSYDLVANPDIKTYLGLANFDFDQSPVRKYRVIVPLLASGVHFVFGPLFNAFAPNTFPGPDFALCLSFLLVNSFFISVFGVLVYYLCRDFGSSVLASIIGLLSVLTCRWTSYIAGLPLVDSLYLVVIGMVLLGIKTKNSRLIILSIFIGPWAKESFIFIAPLIFFFSPVPKWKQLIWFLLSATIVFSFRYFLDSYTGVPISEGIKTDIDHLANIPASVLRLFSFHGVYELFSIIGVWGLLFFFLLNKEVRLFVKQKTTLFMLLFLLIVLVHAILSLDLARMFFLATPVTAIWFALISDKVLQKPIGTTNLS